LTPATVLATRGEPHTFLLRLHELAESARRSHPEGDSVGFGLMIVGDPGGSGELGSLTADSHNFVDRLSLGQGTARCVV
jgi:hypothetical protein